MRRFQSESQGRGSDHEKRLLTLRERSSDPAQRANVSSSRAESSRNAFQSRSSEIHR